MDHTIIVNSKTVSHLSEIRQNPVGSFSIYKDLKSYWKTKEKLFHFYINKIRGFYQDIFC